MVEEFAQATYETQIGFGGTGLGLTISQKLVELHGSKIEVESEIGAGSKFFFVLNLEIGELAPSPEDLDAVSDGRVLEGLRVLIADDSEDNLDLMGHFFKKWGVLFETATNGEEAFQKIQQCSFDVALMDMRMPLMNGYDATVAVRKLSDPVKRILPVIAFSGLRTFGERMNSEMKIFADTVEKPFRPSDLIAKLQKFVRG